MNLQDIVLIALGAATVLAVLNVPSVFRLFLRAKSAKLYGAIESSIKEHALDKVLLALKDPNQELPEHPRV